MGKNKGIGFGLLSDFEIGEYLSTLADRDGRNEHELSSVHCDWLLSYFGWCKSWCDGR